MKKILTIAAMTVVLVCAAYSINSWDSSLGDAEETPAVTSQGELSDAAYKPETYIKITRVIGSRALVRVYSTKEIDKPLTYSLYTIEKKDGKWVRKAYIRNIEIPSVDGRRQGKYQYYSDSVRVDWLSEGHVYQLIPQKKGNNHSSVPFWTTSD